MTNGDVIVLWAAAESPDPFAWAIRAPAGIRFQRIAPLDLALAVPAARARGPVVAIVSSHQDAHRALALGVDEVVRASTATADTLTVAAERARLRAQGREVRAPSTDARAIELLAASVTYRLANPLAVAALNAEVLRAAMGAITGLADAYARDAAMGQTLQGSEVQRVVAMRASAPASTMLAASVSDLAVALREASAAVGHVYALFGEQDTDDPCDLATVVSEVTRLVGVVIERVATLRVEVPSEGGCRCALPRGVVVLALSVLLSNALHAVRDRAERGTIMVRVEPRVTAAIVEVIDDGVGMTVEQVANALDPQALGSDGGARASSLARLSERLRREGGELMLESEPGVGTTARLFVAVQIRPPSRNPAAN